MTQDGTAGEQVARVSAQFVSAASLRVRTDWFNKLRWGAAAGVMIFSSVAALVGGISLPLTPLMGIGALLLVLNAGYTIRNHRLPPVDITAELRLVKLQMAVDLVLLTAVLHFSGGVENPFQFIYIIHVIIASLLFKGREIFHMAWLAIGLFTAMVIGEHYDVLHHYHLLSASDLTHELPYMFMSLGSMWVVLLISARIGAAVMHHNRTIKDELVDKQNDLVKAGRAQIDFFRFVTHEVKSPIVTAQSAVETARELGGDGLPPSAADMLARAVKRLNQAIEIVKDLADLTRGAMSAAPELVELDLVAIVHRVLDNQGESISGRGLDLRTKLPAEPLVVRGDEGMLEKIIGNLVSNAVRYNRDGGALTIELGMAGKHVRLSVADQGIGIAPEDRTRIFEEFYRTRNAREVSNVGTGLGLPIVRRFVEQHGGYVEVDSVPGEGATFSVVLPLRGPRRRRKERS